LKKKAPAETLGNQTRVMIVDDHPTMRAGLRYRIDSQPDMTSCGEAEDASEALRQIKKLKPDVVIVDIRLKDSDGLELVKTIKTRHKSIRTLVHSMYEEAVYADRCLHAGAMGYVSKEADAQDVIDAIRQISQGQVYLSPAMTEQILWRTAHGMRPEHDPLDLLTDRQLEVFRLIGEGKTTHEIAEKLHISAHTVETHRENLKRKLNMENVTELTRAAVLWAEEQH